MSEAAAPAGWASQSARAPPAFAPERTRLDPRDFAELLAEAAELAGWVGFPAADGRIDGDWRRMLAADPAMVLALLASLDIEGRADGLRSLVERARQSRDPDETEWLLERMLTGVLRFAEELDLWLAPAEQGAGLAATAFHALIEEAIEAVLAPRLRGLYALLRRAGEAGLLRRDLPRFDSRLRRRWAIDLAEAEAALLRELLEADWLDRLVERVAELAESFVRQFREIGAHAEAALEASLASGRHPPHVALVMAFARVFAHAQARLNTIPQDLIRFHHEEVLREPAMGPLPDRLTLAFVPRPGQRAFLEKGTLIGAGKNEAGAPIRFATDRDLAVSGARLRSLRLWTQGRGTDGAVEQVEAFLFDAVGDGRIGDEALGIAAAAQPVPLAPAIVLAGDAIALAGGTRRLALELACECGVGMPSPETLQAGLRVAVSTARGWLDLGAAGVAIAWRSSPGGIGFTATLPAELPPIAPCPPVALDSPGAAALRIVADPAAAGGPPWDLLSSLSLAGGSLEVAVKDLPGLVVVTTDGPASPAGAAAFGRAPVPGKTLSIDHGELRGRPLDRLVVRFDWVSVPTDPDGFAGYYRDYLVGANRLVHDRSPFSNAAFQVTMAAPVRGWDATRRLPLFASADPTAATPLPLAPEPDVFAETLDVPPPPGDGRVAATSWFAASGEGEAAACDGPVLLTLAAPEEGFGDGLYLANLHYAISLQAAGEAPPGRPGKLSRFLKAIAKKLAGAAKAIGDALFGAAKALGKAVWAVLSLPARLIDRLEFAEAPEESEDDRPPAPPPPPETVVADPALFLPNPPFAPLVSAIRLDYSRTIPLALLDRFHAVPFEGLKRVPSESGPLLPALPAEITVDLTIERAPPGSLLDLLVRTGGPAIGRSTGACDFLYRAAGGWQKLPAPSILSDESAGLTATGILRLVVPPDAQLADGAVTLRASLAGAAAAPPLLAILPDAVTATRRLDNATDGFAPIPAGTIERAPGIPGIARVVQPLPSAGGRPAEAPESVAARLSERVRHRGRAQFGWDIERLILGEFPDIAKVRVVAAPDPARARPTGEVLAVALPANAAPPGTRPHLPAALRTSIETRLAERASPFARIRLVEPNYVAVDVTARLRLDEGGIEAIEALVADRLSPQHDPGFELDEDLDEIRAAIAALLLRCPGVAGIERLSVAFRDDDGAANRLPIAGTISLAGIASGGKLPW